MRLEVNKGLWVAVSLLVVITLVVGSCSGHPKGMKNVRELTEDEWAKVIEIALTSPKALEWKERESQYRVELEWIGVTWENSEPSGVTMCYLKDMGKFKEMGREETEIFQGSEAIFPGVAIYFGETPEWIVNVAVDLDTETAIDVLNLPITPPTPPRPE